MQHVVYRADKSVFHCSTVNLSFRTHRSDLKLQMTWQACEQRGTPFNSIYLCYTPSVAVYVRKFV
jgi:hypothetical protein